MKFNLDRIRRNAEGVMLDRGLTGRRGWCIALIISCIQSGMTNSDLIVGHVHQADTGFAKPYIGGILNGFKNVKYGEPYWRKDPKYGYALI